MKALVDIEDKRFERLEAFCQKHDRETDQIINSGTELLMNLVEADEYAFKKEKPGMFQSRGEAFRVLSSWLVALLILALVLILALKIIPDIIYFLWRVM